MGFEQTEATRSALDRLAGGVLSRSQLVNYKNNH